MSQTLAGFARALRATAAKLRQTTPLMRDCAETMTAACRANIDGAHDPNGVAWPLLRRGFWGGRPLFDTGKLYHSILPSWSATFAEAGTDLFYAFAHNEGLTIHIPEHVRGPGEKPWVFEALDGTLVFTRRIREHDVTVPQREFVGWGQTLVDAVSQKVADHVGRAFSET